jgi:hypothetical protein
MPAAALKHGGKLVYASDPLIDNKIDPTMRGALQALARAFVQRSNAAGLVGAERDKAALDFWCGAATAAHITGNGTLAEAIGKIGVLDIAQRGYAAVMALALL